MTFEHIYYTVIFTASFKLNKMLKGLNIESIVKVAGAVAVGLTLYAIVSKFWLNK